MNGERLVGPDAAKTPINMNSYWAKVTRQYVLGTTCTN